MTDLVPVAHLGVADPSCLPSDAAGLGSIVLVRGGPCEVRSWSTLELLYETGRHGVDDGGSLQIALRFPWDGGAFQATDPTAPNFVRVTLEAATTRHPDDPLPNVEMSWTPRAARPFFKALGVRFVGGHLRPGDRARIVLGDRSGGSPGLRMQTFAEDHLELRVSVDPLATGHLHPLPQRPTVTVRPGPAVRFRLVHPTLRDPSAAFAIGIVPEDAHGNPTERVIAPLSLASEGLRGVPDALDWPSGARAVRLEVRAAGPGIARFWVRSPFEATSGPIVLEDGARPTWWADFHGQSAETVGVNTVDRYFAFARDLAQIDVAGHQANDFQITDAFWTHLNDVTRRFDEPGRFVAIPGWEWSGNTGVGGDRNVLLRHEDQPIRRSSRALLPGPGPRDAHTALELFAALREEDAIVFAHVGGRWADLSVGHDGRIERAVEVHSAWGTFPWLLDDALSLGHRVGVVANSDGHKGRPGASYPGASTFGALGGLTCVAADHLDREAVFEAVRRRRTYGTSGARLHLEVTAIVPEPAEVFDDDPSLGPCSSRQDRVVRMGEVARTGAAHAEVVVSVAAGCAVERVVIRAGRHRREVLPSAGRGRIRVSWEGARGRGRERTSSWDGHLVVAGPALTRVARFGEHNPERTLVVKGNRVSWSSVTTGNRVGVDLWLDADDRGTLTFAAGGVAQEIDLGALADEHVVAAPGLDRRVRFVRLAAEPDPTPDTVRVRVPIDPEPGRDVPIAVEVWLDDGHRAWASPIYLFRG